MTRVPPTEERFQELTKPVETACDPLLHVPISPVMLT